MDADLLQGSTHAVGAEFRRLLYQFPHLIDRARASFARVPIRDIFEALVAEHGPAFEHFIHPMARRLEIRTDGGIGPPLRVQIDNGPPPLVRVRDLGVRGIAPLGYGRLGSVSQDALDRVITWPALKAEKTNGGNLMNTKAWMFCFQVNNELAHLWRETTPGLVLLWGRRFVEQARHPLLLKHLGLALQPAFTPTTFSRTLRSLPAKHDPIT